ncbi:MAG: radical SAM family heme chaperone HemW [Ectothiorhodospiraceae bacterium]|nr:radical SAM family heme chaperone HemW [Ectothiorhodospiraceae bacterium]
MHAPPLSLYVHIPWCVRKCPYCDFNSHAAPARLPVADYLAALRADLAGELASAPGRQIQTVFIGGGTPSLFPPQAIAQLLEDLRPHLPTAAEITLEANPGTVEQARFADFRQAGVNRLSIGVQSFNPQMLRRLGRIHGRDEAVRAAEAAVAAGFSNFNLDLMFALPEQTLAQMLDDLRYAVALDPPHLSHYQLTLEPNTVFYSKPPALPDDDSAWAMQQAAGEVLAGHGYSHYEVSAWARQGRECRHNRNYWLFGDYLAIGAGAHGKLTNPVDGSVRRYRKAKVPALYMGQVRAGTPNVEERRLHRDDLVLEFMMNALRLSDGFTIPMFEQRTGLPFKAAEPGLGTALEHGWVEQHGERIRTTAQGRCFLNAVLELFLPEG